MTDKEFKRLNRAQLIDIIYQLQLQIDELTQQNQELESALEDKQIRIKSAGNLAKAALEINDCFSSAQRAADQYLSGVKLVCEETEAECKHILARARARAAAIIYSAKKAAGEPVTNLDEALQDQPDNG